MMAKVDWADRWRAVQAAGQQFFQFVILTATVALLCLVAAQAAGVMPWPDLALGWNGHVVPGAGMWAELGLAGLFLALVFFLPANLRMARLERSHRNFAMGMDDVARAYRMAHAADRASVFTLSTEFDALRERMLHLRQHPDLAHLEPELLQLAAQMSFETRDLARTYSDDKVARAKIFLQQRQEEVTALTERLGLARRTCDELRRWLSDIEAEERTAQSQLRRLEADLKEILPSLGYDFDLTEAQGEANVVSLPLPGTGRGENIRN